MIVYIDNDNKCYAEAAEGLRAVETYFFDGKCKKFIEGFRFVPEGETWKREDGEVFSGEMFASHEDCTILEAAQKQYEESQQTIAEYEAALSAIEEALGV